MRSGAPWLRQRDSLKNCFILRLVRAARNNVVDGPVARTDTTASWIQHAQGLVLPNNPRVPACFVALWLFHAHCAAAAHDAMTQSLLKSAPNTEQFRHKCYLRHRCGRCFAGDCQWEWTGSAHILVTSPAGSLPRPIAGCRASGPGRAPRPAGRSGRRDAPAPAPAPPCRCGRASRARFRSAQGP